MVQTSTVVTASVATVITGALAYAAYFDYKRRAEPEFRRNLRRNERQRLAPRRRTRRQSQLQRQKTREAVANAIEEGFPATPPRGKSNTLFEAALAFYKALKVYPSPGDLIGIYDQTVSKQVLDILAELIAADPTLKIGTNAEGESVPVMPLPSASTKSLRGDAELRSSSLATDLPRISKR
ncbi:unnamed protein product [Parascedosporium putredinis]|uniref:Mitochondrial import receptor subunit tom20 n=1 Tax=Parascedosporium putredinis TaxID=1442378 RepID=A0A9P1H7E9_9PEZI|nr:unnamed protein product [Parascedosporium putredinis]CAI7998817.1 unnamed protein product [Parascedosporium putredinis]